jgi:hypothetical protein
VLSSGTGWVVPGSLLGISECLEGVMGSETGLPIQPLILPPNESEVVEEGLGITVDRVEGEVVTVRAAALYTQIWSGTFVVSMTGLGISSCITL